MQHFQYHRPKLVDSEHHNRVEIYQLFRGHHELSPWMIWLEGGMIIYEWFHLINSYSSPYIALFKRFPLRNRRAHDHDPDEALLDSQIAAQKQETEAAMATLREASREMEAIQFEKHLGWIRMELAGVGVDNRENFCVASPPYFFSWTLFFFLLHLSSKKG